LSTFAIGDIHGQLAPLEDLLARLVPEVQAGDTVVFLGDYIDRGHESKQCVDAVLAFEAASPADVVFLLGNHEDWLLKTMRDPTSHSWLLGMDGLTAIRSYSPDAAAAILAAAEVAGGALYGGHVALPYDRFFAAMPAAHVEFFTGLGRWHVTPDCFSAHAGVDPAASDFTDASRAHVWGASGFPESYAGSQPIVYGHFNDAFVDAEGWPRVRVVGQTYGLDTISHGVLTAIRLPDLNIYQSARYVRREDLGSAWDN
jgi:serine/threonine protein phosphatase 1